MVQEFAGGALPVQHQDRVCLELLQADCLALQREILLIGDEDIVKFVDHPDVLRIGEAGVGIVGDDEINLSVFQ